MRKITLNYLTLAVLMIAFTSCQHDDEQENNDTNLEIRLNSVSAPFDAVNIDIEGIFVNATDDINTGWRRLDLMRSGVYNLLDYQNGLDVLLTAQNFPPGNIKHVRLVLASNNSVVKGGIAYPLKISLVIMNVNELLMPGASYRLWLDFDIRASVVKTDDETYLLIPMVRTYTENTGGTIEGNIADLPEQTVVWAVLKKDSILAHPNADGYFRIAGLQESPSWKIIYDIIDNDHCRDIEITNVVVKCGQTTTLERITAD